MNPAVQQAKSFEEITAIEAVTRRVRVDLVLDPVSPGADTRLISRFLGFDDTENVVLAVPWAQNDQKVFVPVKWKFGMAFEMGGLWLQGCSEVVGHCQFPLRPAQKVDAMVVELPERIQATNRRRKQRHAIDPSKVVTATLWTAEGGEGDDTVSVAVEGRLVNWSDGGLCVKLSPPLCWAVSTEVFVRLQSMDDGECPILRGIIKHYTFDVDGSWDVGLGEVKEVGPGESFGMLMARNLTEK